MPNPPAKILYKGEELTLTELSAIAGICRSTLKNRLGELGWDINKAMETPARKKGSGKKFEGVPCGTCGSTIRYFENHNCVACVADRNKMRKQGYSVSDTFVDKVLALLDQREGKNIKQMVEALGTTSRAVRTALQGLEGKGLVDKCGRSKWTKVGRDNTRFMLLSGRWDGSLGL